MMNIKFQNCNNIENGEIKLVENCINIKYAINGTGKTTISKAIEMYINDKNKAESKLMQLKPFKYRKIKENNPQVTGLEGIADIAIFNEEYISKYVYQKDELLKNSFDVFIKNEKYENGMNEINNLIKSIRETFENNEEMDILIKDLNELCDCFGKPTKTGFSAASSIAKGIGSGNKVENIPEGLEVYRKYIHHPQNTKWLGWQITGNNFLDIADICPYCTSEIDDKKETIQAVSKEYDSKLIEHLNKVIGVLQRLNIYLTTEVNESLEKITKTVDGLTKDQRKYLLDLWNQIDNLRNRLFEIRRLSFNTLKDVDKVIEIINELKIDLTYFPFMNTETTRSKIESINKSLEEISDKADKLQGEINKQKKNIKDTIEAHKKDINQFLKYAGYSYHVDIIEDKPDGYKLKLRHNEHTETIDNATLHLSYGERNAFALVMFMYETLKNPTGLIVLDDPISSFDKNKKFAIINMLFRGENSFRGKTVLMLTHDFDPIIDMVYTLPHFFDRVPQASFLENVEGVLSEKEISKDDIKTFLDIAKENINNLEEDVNKLIYLRRVYEINNEKGVAYQLLSNLFHKREIPKYIANGTERPMTSEEIETATNEIISAVPGFEYQLYYSIINDTREMVRIFKKSDNNYEKLQIYRIINNGNNDNEVIRKFVNETFHIENDYLFQLNPCKYQTVPHYIIEECKNDIEEICVA